MKVTVKAQLNDGSFYELGEYQVVDDLEILAEKIWQHPTLQAELRADAEEGWGCGVGSCKVIFVHHLPNGKTVDVRAKLIFKDGDLYNGYQESYQLYQPETELLSFMKKLNDEGCFE